MHANPLISIIIPTYNYDDKLPRAVNSVLKQLTARHELIVIDDGSTDSTQAVLADLHRENQNFRMIYKENGGLASVRNLGVSEALADYLIFLDADDELEGDALSHIEQHIDKNPSSKMIIGGYTSVSSCGVNRRLSLPDVLPNDPVARVKSYLIDKTISLANGATVMHRSLFERGLYPEYFRNAEDLPVFAQALGNYECSILKESIALIHRHEASLRHNVAYDKEVGLAVVSEIFSSGRLPSKFKVLKEQFVAQRALSLFRAYYAAGLYNDAKEMYLLALKSSWRSLFKISYTRKFIKMLVMRQG
ncbi:MAG TPA: glycosyltransferase family 2 protein [Oligella sp.]|nr:glycosyltransferase family 2 protein [Oligella sp.]